MYFVNNIKYVSAELSIKLLCQNFIFGIHNTQTDMTTMFDFKKIAETILIGFLALLLIASSVIWFPAYCIGYIIRKLFKI